MQIDYLKTIDWHRPWLAPFTSVAAPLLQADDWRRALNEAAQQHDLRNHQGLPIRFVPQADLPVATAYESFISDTGCVPTRDNLHDFFNSLVWLRFPLIKRQLNALQAAEIKNAGGLQARGAVRDAATIFDENSALVIAADEAWVADLRSHRWHEALFVSQNIVGRAVDIVLFGHALIEKLVTPYKAITAHAWVIAAGPDYFSMRRQEQLLWIDERVAQQLDHEFSSTLFTPLPVLGVPGWCNGQDAAYYADSRVFRAKRQRK